MVSTLHLFINPKIVTKFSSFAIDLIVLMKSAFWNVWFRGNCLLITNHAEVWHGNAHCTIMHWEQVFANYFLVWIALLRGGDMQDRPKQPLAVITVVSNIFVSTIQRPWIFSQRSFEHKLCRQTLQKETMEIASVCCRITQIISQIYIITTNIAMIEWKIFKCV